MRARVVHGRGVNVEQDKTVSIGLRFALRFQNAQGGLMELFIESGGRAVNPLPQNFRRREALQPQQAPKGHVVPVGAHRLETGLAQSGQGDLSGVDGSIGNGFQLRGPTRPAVEPPATG